METGIKDQIVIPVWAFGNFLVVMNTTMFNVSVPTIIRQLSISAGLASWIVSGYSIGFALSTILFSRLSDFFPIRKLLAVGLTIMGLSSFIGLFADNFGLVLTARLLQSCGAGAMPGLGMVLASRYVPYARRGRAISLIASGSALAFGLGPVVGGMITQYIGWRELFLVTCLVLGLVPALWPMLPKKNEAAGYRFDTLGATLLVVTTSSLLIAVTTLSWIALGVGLAALAALVVHLRGSKQPFVQPALFRNAGYRKLILLAFLGFVLNMSMLFLMPMVLANGFHKEAGAVGLMIFPGAMLSAFLMRFVGRWIDRYGNWRFLAIGLVCLGVAVGAVALAVQSSAYVIMAAYMVFAPSLSTLTSSLSNEVSRILPKELLGSGMGLSQLMQYLGGAFAVALCGLYIVGNNGAEPIEIYQQLYLLLALVVIVALSLLAVYIRSARKSGLQAG